MLLERGRALHAEVDEAEEGAERPVRRLHGDLDGVVVDRLDVGQGRQEAGVREALAVADALQVELHRLGVERRAVVEGDALAELQRPALAVRRDPDVLREPGHEPLGRPPEEALEDLLAHDEAVVGQGPGHVEAVRLARLHHPQGAAALGRLRPGGSSGPATRTARQRRATRRWRTDVIGVVLRAVKGWRARARARR